MATKTLRLGKAPARVDPRTLKAARYMRALPPPPASADWTKAVIAWGMCANDQLGDCTIAAAAHLMLGWTANAQPPGRIPSDSDIIAAYSAITGYSPLKIDSDNGAVELDVLNYWRTSGIAGDKLTAFAAVNVHNQQEVMQAIALFGGIYTGIALPNTAKAQVGFTWDAPGWMARLTEHADCAPGSWGGHAVPIVAYDADGLTCVTWGALQRMTWAFFFQYCDEAYALVTDDFVKADGQSPSGFDLPTLAADLADIT